MCLVDREIANLVTAIAGGLNNPSVKARLDALEAERAVLLAESAKPAPAAISLHPGAASLWRAKIRALWAALGEGDGAAMTRETLRSEEHTSELQSLMRISYAVFCLNKKKITRTPHTPTIHIIHHIHNTVLTRKQSYKTTSILQSHITSE